MWDPVITKWLGGIEPAWTMLDHDSRMALRHPPSPVFGAIRLAADFTPEEIRQSAVARNALILLGAAATGPGLKLTATGNLSRTVVAEMNDRTDWPGYDKNLHMSVSKVMNEPECPPLFLLRHVVEAARLVRRYKGHLRATPGGRKMLQEPNAGALQAVLFNAAFWYVDLGYVGWWTPYGAWPQCDAGTILWSLSVAAHDWQSPEKLTRLCTIPTRELFDRPWDHTDSALESQILRPLMWFGLLDRHDKAPGSGEHCSFRKTPLFDRFLSFDVRLAASGVSHH